MSMDGGGKMRTTMTSRERLLCAMACEEPDHVPLWNLWRSEGQPFDGRSPQRIPIVLDKRAKLPTAEFKTPTVLE